MRPLTALTAAAALAAAGLVAAPAAHAASTSVTHAQFRWGINNETNNRAFAPLTYNLVSAGRLGDPGASVTLDDATQGATWSNGTPAGWNNNTGNVFIEKQTGGSYAAATWGGFKTDTDGLPITSPTSGRFSGHQVVIDEGTGTLDPVADDASIAWDGDFTVAYYSGSTFFYVSDPRLTLSGGSGVVTATVSGYGSDMTDTSRWTALLPKQVVLATITGADVTTGGIADAVTAYRAVTYAAPAGATPQERTSAHWGSFPQSFVDFQQCTGGSSYWYSSGGSVDANKPTLPLSVLATPRPHTGTVAALPATGTTPTPSTAAGCTAEATTPPVTTPAPTPATPTGPASPATPAKAAPRTVSVSLARRPTATRAGTVTVAVKAPGATPTGRVTLTLARGTGTGAGAGTKAATKKVRARLKAGRAVVTLPRLAPGRWTLTTSYAGDAAFEGASAKPLRLTVR